ncbi:MAG: hypothetical protein COC04_02120 [Gammaproteobacteria bacterium]|nr:MAG: hypothetical protein COC04_02120 [Gammaproteobacteria bacterium]
MDKMELIGLNTCDILIELKPPKLDMLGISIKNELIIFREESYSRVKNKYLKDQLEAPASALVWAVDTIENGFGKKPNEGGLPRNVLHAETTIESEKLYLRRTMNCGAPNQQGYTLKNFSRFSYIDSDDYQEIQLPDYLLFDEGLLDKLKHLATTSKP